MNSPSSKLHLLLLLALASAFATLAIPNTIYIIRNAETPSLGLEGLTPVGQQRADECIPLVFGTNSQYNIGLVIACTPEANNTDCHTAVATATPLATALGLTVDTSCGTTNWTSETCVTDLISSFGRTSTQSVLVVWDVEYISDLLDNFDLENDESDFPEDTADVIFTIRNDVFIGQSSQECPGIDGSSTGSGNSSLSGMSTGHAKVSGSTGGNVTFDGAESFGEPVEGIGESSSTKPNAGDGGTTVEPSATEPVVSGFVGPEPTSTEMPSLLTQINKMRRVHARRRHQG